MAKFNLVLDRRIKKKNDKYNLAVRVIHNKEVMFINLMKMTEKQYDSIFVKKAMDHRSIDFRNESQAFLNRCEKIFSQLESFDKAQFRKLVFQKESEPLLEKSLKIKDLFEKYLQTNTKIKIRTKELYTTSKNVLETFLPGATISDITPEFLKQFEIERLKTGASPATISSYLRNLRSVVNHFMKVEKLIPATYEYPFGKGGYSVRDFWGKKIVISNDEIAKVVEMKDFETKSQEYARDIWLLLYRCNGINMADLLRLKWTNIKGNYFVFIRMKTESTRKNNIQEITVPITPKIQEIIDKVGDKNSPFILGLLKEGYSDHTFKNRLKKFRRTINTELTNVSSKIELSVPLKIKTARETYATTLKRAGVSKDNISEMLGHSNSVVTEHYLASLDMEKTFEINGCLF